MRVTVPPGLRPSRQAFTALVCLVLVTALLSFREDIKLITLRLCLPTKLTRIKDPQKNGFTTLEGKTPSEETFQADRSQLFLVIGQSNVSNSGEGAYQPRHPLLNLHGGRLYTAASPLLGTDGAGSNPVLEALDLYAGNHPGERVVILPIAVSGSSVFDWTRTGQLHAKLASAVDQSRRAGLPITHVIYHQGEADCAIGTPAPLYRSGLKSLLRDLRDLGVTAPVFLGMTSLYKRFDCPDVSDPGCYALCPELIEVQKEVVRTIPGVYAGVDSDRVVASEHRYDGYHFDADGQTHFARELARLLDEKHKP